MKRISLHDKKKINIQRDYSKGTSIRFKTDYPLDISHLISEDAWISYVSELNFMYEDAVKITGRTVCESLLGLFTCYVSRLCVTPLGYKKLDQIDDFINEKNEKLMVPKGIFVANPIERGFRVMEITLIHERPEIKQQPEVYQNLPKSPLIPR